MSLENFVEISPIEDITYYLNKKLRENKEATIYYSLSDIPYIRIDENIAYIEATAIAQFIQNLKQKYEFTEYEYNNEIVLTIVL
jgi:hypothetical protein